MSNEIKNLFDRLTDFDRTIDILFKTCDNEDEIEYLSDVMHHSISLKTNFFKLLKLKEQPTKNNQVAGFKTGKNKE